MKILQKLKHKNIVDLVEMITDKEESKAERRRQEANGILDASDFDDDSIYMVFEYAEYDLSGLLEYHNQDARRKAEDHTFASQVSLKEAHVKSYMKQLCDGVEFMHKNKFLHRDLKSPNVLVDRHGCLKIGDWGLARNWTEKQERYTTPVITLWYRPPELLMGMTKYGFAIDMWSVGCIFGELLQKKPLMAAMQNSEAQQLECIWDLLGTPKLHSTPGANACADNPDYQYDVWSSAASCPLFESMNVAERPRSRRLQQKFGGEAHLVRPESSRARDDKSKDDIVLMLDLLERMLALDPKQRISAKDALDHEYFWYQGGKLKQPCQPHELPKFSVASVHELDARNRAREAKEKRVMHTHASRYSPCLGPRCSLRYCARGCGSGWRTCTPLLATRHTLHGTRVATSPRGCVVAWWLWRHLASLSLAGWPAGWLRWVTATPLA
mmetsp:Transcript_68892/g.192442  ORF Transcript_68892/g.192442 Transcript_68892/m.192442 type:complete len:440 (-) Transcript_68892:2424-3743(-)